MTLLLITVAASAHQPDFSDDESDWSSWETADELGDPDVSIVRYREVTCEAPELWLTFDAEPEYEVFLQLGVPEIERLAAYRPAIAILAPGLPAADLPFPTPEGVGARVFEAASAGSPATFYEPFTQTSSWVWVEETVTLPEGGPAWVVAWHPERVTGKLWVAVGTVEDFSDVDVAEAASWGELVNDFHETGVYSTPPEVEEQVCVDPPGDEAAAEGAEAGCDHTGGSSARWAALLALGAVAARRRSRRA